MLKSRFYHDTEEDYETEVSAFKDSYAEISVDIKANPTTLNQNEESVTENFTNNKINFTNSKDLDKNQNVCPTDYLIGEETTYRQQQIKEVDNHENDRCLYDIQTNNGDLKAGDENPNHSDSGKHEFDLIVYQDPVIDLTTLEELHGVDDNVDQHETPSEPSAYEMSLLRKEKEEDAENERICSKPGDLKSKVVVTEDILINCPYEDNVYAEMSYLDDENDILEEGLLVKNDEVRPEANDSKRYSSPLVSTSPSDDETLPDHLQRDEFNISPLECISSPDVDVSSSPEINSSHNLVLQESLPVEIPDELIESVSIQTGDCNAVNVVKVQKVTSETKSVVVTASDKTVNDCNDVQQEDIPAQATTLTKTTKIITTETTVVSGLVTDTKDLQLSSTDATGDCTEKTIQLKEPDENGEQLIKRMFENQSSVLNFFDGDVKEDKEDYSEYGSQV